MPNKTIYLTKEDFDFVNSHDDVNLSLITREGLERVKKEKEEEKKDEV